MIKKDFADTLKTTIIAPIVGVKKVTNALLTRNRVQEYPTFSIQFGPATRKSVLESGKGAYDVRATYVVIGYINAATDTLHSGLLTIAALEWQEKIVNAILAYTNSQITVFACDSEEPFLDYENNYAEISIIVTVDYIHAATT